MRFVLIRLLLAIVAVAAAIVVGLSVGPGRASLLSFDLLAVVVVAAAGGAAAVLSAFAIVTLALRPWRSRGRPERVLRLEAWAAAAASFGIGTGMAKAAFGPPVDVGFLVLGMAAVFVAGTWIGAAAVRVTIRRDRRAERLSLYARRVGLAFVATVLAGFLLSRAVPTPADVPESRSFRADLDRPAARFLCVFVDGVDRVELETLAAPFGPGTTVRIDANEALPPTFWETVATGSAPHEHDLRGSASRRVLLRRSARYRSYVREPWGDAFEALAGLAPVPGSARPDPWSAGRKPIWLIASEAGCTVGVAGAWNSWPAPRVRRFSVADVAPVVCIDSPDASGATGSAWPVGLAWPDGNPEWSEGLRGLSATIRAATGGVESSVPGRADAFVLGALARGIQSFPPVPDLLVLQLIGPDLAGLGPDPKRARRAHLDWLAARLRELGAQVVGKDRVVVFVAHPGVCRAGDAPVLWIGGAGGRRRGSGRVTPLSLAPTLLHGLGIPLSQELAGSRLDGLLPPTIEEVQTRWVDSYGRHRPSWSGREGRAGATPVPGLPYLSR